MKFSSQKYLSFSLILLLAMIAFDSPIWISLFSGLLIGYKILSETKNFPIISRRITTALSILLLALIYAQFRTFLGQEASTTLIMGLTALKIVDYENQRDHKYLVILGFMLLAMKPLFSLDLYWTPFLFIGFFGLWLSMLSPSQKKPFQFISRIFVLSIPMTVVLFFLFPRVILPWAKKNSRPQSKTGFSEQLSPGTTSELVQTNVLVFRTKFFNFTPRPNQLYWRGAVLNKSEGLSWKIEGDRNSSNNKNIISSENTRRIKYDVYLEPGNQTYIFALETPNSINGETFFVRSLEGSIFRSNLSLEKTFLYRGISTFGAFDTTRPGAQDLQVPELSSKVQSFVDQNKSKLESDRIKALNNFFVSSKFKYTLNPGVYGENELEEFLFDRKEGFCEHFAGGYATLARAMGIPARVIVGFQGGAWNSFGDFWRISTKDAHAWVEVYLENRWQRIDPTALVTPMRIELGAEQFFEDALASRTDTQKNFQKMYESVLAWVENINYTWMAFLIDFDKEYQKDLIQSIRQNLGWILLGFISLLISVKIISQWLLNKYENTNEYQVLLREIFTFGNKKGLPRSKDESPEKYLERLSGKFQTLRPFSKEFVKSYESNFYENKTTGFSKDLKKSWKKAKSQITS
ncbi:MAG: DUF3488 and transglutaminase-like domain-containing protein [Bdellovibrionota bacterium]